MTLSKDWSVWGRKLEYLRNTEKQIKFNFLSVCKAHSKEGNCLGRGRWAWRRKESQHSGRLKQKGHRFSTIEAMYALSEILS